MGYWQSKVVPKIKKVFEKNSTKKAAAAEACKSFDDSKEEYSKQFEEKKDELQAKVTELYETLAAEVKAFIKDPKPTGLKKHTVAVDKFLDELSKLEFPGSKPAYEASTKYGATYVPGPIFFVFEKVSTYIVVEEKKEVEVAEEVPAAAATTEETSGTEKDKEIAVGEEKKEVAAEAEAEAEPEKTTEAAPAEPPKAAEECAPTEPPKP